MTKHYSRMSVAEKAEHNRQHALPDRCDVCFMVVPPSDWKSHKSRCAGRAEPDRLDRWVTRLGALKEGASKRSLMRWASNGKLRTKLSEGSRMYLFRDLIKLTTAAGEGASGGTLRNAKPKELTKSEPKGYPLRMGAAPNELRKRINAYAAKVGGFAKAARKMDVPTNTLKRAVSGKAIRDGSVLHIEAGLKEVGA